jgi:tRNA threonylcarbamoyladenosine biosynthesis protein TsaB
MPGDMADELLLAIETSGPHGGVGLALGAQTLGVRQLATDRRHTAELLPTIRDLLGEHGRRLADVDVFAFSRGPGSFTGLRVAATIGQMMQSVVGCRVVAVPTLEVIARNALAHPDRLTRIVALLDARRGQVYAAVFERVDDDTLRCATEAGLHEPAALLDTIAPPFWIVGDGVQPYADVCAASRGAVLDETYWPPAVEQVLALARRMAADGRVCRPEEIVPLYLRPPACEEVYEQRRAEARRRRGE